MLLAGTEEIGRSTERQSKSAYDFTGSMLGMVRDSHANVSAAKTRVQAQRKAYHDLNAERDSLRVEKESLTSTVEETRTRLRDKDAELEVVNEARKVLEKEVDAKAHRLATVEKQVNALNDQNKDLGAQIATKEREVAQAEVRRTELAAKHKELEKKLIASQNARDEAEAHAAKLEEANAALEEEIAAGEEAVLALQRQTEESFSALQTDREALLSRNESLQKQMAESQTASTRFGRKPRRSSRRSKGGRRSSRRRTRRRCWSWRRRGAKGRCGRCSWRRRTGNARRSIGLRNSRRNSASSEAPNKCTQRLRKVAHHSCIHTVQQLAHTQIPS
jgi:chromosome segregation ATPase